MALSDVELANPGSLAVDPVWDAQSDRPSEPPSEAQRYVPSTTWPPFLALGMTALNLIVMFAISTLPLMVAGTLGRVHIDGSFLKHLVDPEISALVLGGSLVAQLLATMLLLWSTQWRGGRMADTLSLRPPIDGAKTYLWAIPAFVLFGALSGAILQWLSPQSNLSDTQVMLKLAQSPAWWLFGLVAVVGAPLYEELVFRGFLFSALARTPLGLIGTAIITSILWALIHGYSLQGISAIFALGLALSAILWRTGSTRVTMACHAAYNAMAFMAALVSTPTV